MFLLAVGTFQTQGNLLGSLSLLVENGLGLSTKTRLLTVITSLTYMIDKQKISEDASESEKLPQLVRHWIFVP
jgi:hypothetical protein